MCTAFTFNKTHFYFGRNMDIEYHFGEKVVITPRNYKIATKKAGILNIDYAMIGMATVVNDYPLYAEAVNEKGLCMAGLNFPSYASYIREDKIKKTAVTPFELIPYILGKCADIEEAKALIETIDIVDIAFSKSMPLAPLHWIIADKNASITLECTQDGMHIYDNAFGVITNNPPFPFHQENARQYLNLSPENTPNNFAKDFELKPFGQGMGAIGLPGDFSPASRFIKTLFCKANSVCDDNENACVSQVFHILDSVAMVSGSVITPDKKPDITTYSACINASKGIYYYKTYDNNQITMVQMTEERKNADALTVFPLRTEQNIFVE